MLDQLVYELYVEGQSAGFHSYYKAVTEIDSVLLVDVYSEGVFSSLILIIHLDEMLPVYDFPLLDIESREIRVNNTQFF